MTTANAFFNVSTIQDVEIKEPIEPTWVQEPLDEAPVVAKALKTIVVYNPANMEAVLAAAIVKQTYPSTEFYEAGVDLPTTGDQYLWLNITPTTTMFPSTHGLGVWRQAKHFVSLSGQPLRQFKVKILSVGQTVVHNENTEEQPIANSVGYLLNYLGIDATKYNGLVELVHLFYERNTDIDTLAYIYANVKRAQESMETGVFTLEEPSVEQLEKYMKAVQEAKLALNKSYTVRDLIVDKMRTKVILTCNTKEFWITRRLTSFTYKNYANSVMMLNGPSVQTNLNVAKLFNTDAVTVLN